MKHLHHNLFIISSKFAKVKEFSGKHFAKTHNVKLLNIFIVSSLQKSKITHGNNNTFAVFKFENFIPSYGS